MNETYKNKTRRVVSVAVAVAVFAACAAAIAKNAPRVKLTMIAEKIVVTQKDGKRVETRRPAENVEPGDTILYTVRYENTGEDPARNVVIVDPVPEGTVLKPGSATGDASITYSINGGKDFKPYPVMYTAVQPDGTHKKVEAPAMMYTHVRWIIAGPIAPGASGNLSFRAVAR